MTKFTVLLLYPDYLADNYGEETYLAFVDADSVAEAEETAQRIVSNANEGSEPEDFLTLFVCTGHKPDLKVGD
jgi:hypothetical protein